MSELQNEPTTGEPNEELQTQHQDETSNLSELEKKEADIQKLKGQWGSEKADMMRAQRDLENKIATLEGRVTEQSTLLTSQQEPAADPFALTEEQQEDFNNNPALMAEYFRSVTDARVEQAMGAVFDTLKARDEYVDTSMNNVRSLAESIKKEFDPELLPWKGAIADLRKNDKLSKLDDETLVEIAKSTGVQPAMEWRGGAGGQRQRTATEKPRAFDPNSAEGRVVMQLERGDTAQAEALWKRMEERRVQNA